MSTPPSATPRAGAPPGEKPRWSKATTQETWTAMEGLVEKGLAKSIGVANFQSQLLFDVLRYAKITPASLQVEIHPYYQQKELVKMAQNEGIYVTAYSSFGPTGFIECNMDEAKNAKPLMEHEVIKGIAEKVGKTPAQVLLRWATQRGLAVIPKTYREPIMKQNLDCVSWDIPQEGMDEIAKLEMNLKFNKPTNYFEAENLYIFG
jgi:D-xylose reductase